MNNNTEQEAFEQITTERNEYITEFLKKNPGLRMSFSEMEQGFMFRKLAALQAEIQELRKGQQRADGFLNMHTPIGGV